MSDSVRPHRRQPTRLPRPWDSPGKKTGVGCHFLLQCMTVKSDSEVTQSCPTLCDPIDGSPPGSPIPGILQARILKWVAISFSITPPRMAEIKKSDYSMCWWEYEQIRTFILWWWECIRAAAEESSLASLWIVKHTVTIWPSHSVLK